MEINHRSGMKAENQRHILNLINQSPASRAAIASRLGLTQASVSQLTDELIGDGIICPIGPGRPEAAVGRRPELLDIRADWGLAAGLSFDRTQVTVGLSDLKGAVGECRTVPMREDCHRTIEEAVDCLRALLAEYGAGRYLLGAGVAVPGPMDREEGRILDPPGLFKSWYQLPIRELLSRQLSVPVYVEHNSRAFAEAELCWGAGKKYRNFVVLNVSAGIGSGLVLGGEIYYGASGIGCEVGHLTAVPNGQLCFCGKRGCLEQYASVSAILHEARRLRPELTDYRELVDLAYEGDGVCNRMLEIEASYLGELVSNLVSFCDPEAVLFTGQIAYRGEKLLSLIKRSAGQAVSPRLSFPRIKLSAISGDPYLMSAAAVLIYRLYHQPLFYYESSARRRQWQLEDKAGH